MEYLDYDLVKAKMDELNTVFGNYDQLLTDINNAITDGINNGEKSAILSSILGEAFLQQWDKTSDSFKGFKAKFDSIYAEVGQVTQNNADLEETATALFYGADSAAAGSMSQSTNGTPAVHSGSSQFTTVSLK